MRAKGPTFRLLDGAWLADAGNALQRDHVSLGTSGLKLEESHRPGSPLSFGSSDGSLGRLGLPRGMALDGAGMLYLLGPEGSWIKRFDAGSKRFVRLRGIGGEGADARHFHGATNIAIAGRNLYVADRGNLRVQVFALESLALRHVWGPFDAADVCSAAGVAYILDAEKGRVYRHTPGADKLVGVVYSKDDTGRWSRVLVDPVGRLYLFDAEKAELAVYDASGKPVERVANAGDIRDRFTTPPVQVNHLGLFQLAGGLTFDLRGHPAQFDPAAPLGPKPYETRGVWISRAQDSDIYRCPWHRIEMEAELPTGTRLVVSTYTDSQADRDILALHGAWETRYTAVSPIQTAGSAAVSTEFLIQSLEGQYLWLKVELEGDGYATPALRLLRIHYPRESYLEHLPAIYGSDEEGRRFLERFLAVFKTEWDRLELRNAEIARYFDPKAVPAGPFMDWLAGWLALPLEQSWTPEQKRKLLEAAPKLYPRLGKPDGVRDYLRLYLENLGGALPPEYPIVVEGFRQRRRIISLAGSPLGREGSGAPMWSTGVVGRLQLGEFSRVGEARLVSAGDPEGDVFRVYAHRFQVFAPAASVKTANDERMLRRALDAVKPGHTAYDLCLVEPRFRIGVQSSLGLDTMIGGYPAARLACGKDDEAAPSGPPRSRLGYDTVLSAGEVSDAGFRLTRPGVRAGVDAILR
jgi:phage tail-like protein